MLTPRRGGRRTASAEFSLFAGGACPQAVCRPSLSTVLQTMLLRSAVGGVRRTPPTGRCHGMLVLTRKSNQSIMIGDDVEVSVLSVMGEKVRIGIQAPQEIPVFRKEIYLEIHRDDGLGAGREEPASSDEAARAEVADASEAE